MRLEPAGDALGHWWKPYFEDDLDRARALGLTCYRLSVEWSRVEPAAPASVTDWITANNGKASNDVAVPPAKLDPAVFDAKALARYREMVDAIRARGMEPLVLSTTWLCPTGCC